MAKGKIGRFCYTNLSNVEDFPSALKNSIQNFVFIWIETLIANTNGKYKKKTPNLLVTHKKIIK